MYKYFKKKKMNVLTQAISFSSLSYKNKWYKYS